MAAASMSLASPPDGGNEQSATADGLEVTGSAVPTGKCLSELRGNLTSGTTEMNQTMKHNAIHLLYNYHTANSAYIFPSDAVY